jgi:hypothetical protein
MMRIRLLFCALLACSAFGAFTASQALASHSQVSYFEGSGVLLDPVTREAAIAQLQTRGVRALRVELYWDEVAPDPTSPTRPSFDATDPANYRWGTYDWLLTKAHELHWQVLLTVTGPVPKWATAAHTDYLTRPNAQQFKQFMTAVGRHYGSLVSLYSIWNEPNHPAFLLPQFASNHQPASPRIYRELFQEGYAGLQGAGIPHPRVLMGETAPSGSDTGSGKHDVAPLAFLRGVLCLNSKYKKSSSCGSLPAYGYAHHAYTEASGPSYVPPGKDNVMIGVLSRLTSALDKAAKAHAIKAHMPVYLTEFGFQTRNNSTEFLGVSPAKQVEYDAIAEHIAWSNPRVAAFSQYLLRDDPPSSGAAGSSANGGYIGFQTGLEYLNGTPKPLYAGWAVPLVVSKQGHAFSLWGLVRPTLRSTKATILVKTKGAKSYRVLKSVTTNSLGYWTLRSNTKGVAWRVRWSSPTGVKYEGPPIGAS